MLRQRLKRKNPRSLGKTLLRQSINLMQSVSVLWRCRVTLPQQPLIGALLPLVDGGDCFFLSFFAPLPPPPPPQLSSLGARPP